MSQILIMSELREMEKVSSGPAPDPFEGTLFIDNIKITAAEEVVSPLLRKDVVFTHYGEMNDGKLTRMSKENSHADDERLPPRLSMADMQEYSNLRIQEEKNS